MALVRRPTHKELHRFGISIEVECTYSVVDAQYLQIATYGSKSRRNPDTVSQTIRFAPEAIETAQGCSTKALLEKHDSAHSTKVSDRLKSPLNQKFQKRPQEPTHFFWRVRSPVDG